MGHVRLAPRNLKLLFVEQVVDCRHSQRQFLLSMVPVHMAFLFKGGRLIQVKITKKDKHGTATGWPRPLNRDGRLIQVPNTTFVCAKNRDFKNWPLNRGPLYTGSTV